MGDVTYALKRMRAGDGLAAEELLQMIYGQLRGLASRCMSGERADHTLQATALVHEAYVRLAPQHQVDWEGRTHFFAAAAKAMRRVLVDHARKRHAEKRGGGNLRLEIDDLEPSSPTAADQLELLALHEALAQLEAFDERKAQVVELRYFAGLSSIEAAEVLGVTARTVDRDWLFAQAWLADKMRGS